MYVSVIDTITSERGQTLIQNWKSSCKVTFTEVDTQRGGLEPRNGGQEDRPNKEAEAEGRLSGLRRNTVRDPRKHSFGE